MFQYRNPTTSAARPNRFRRSRRYFALTAAVLSPALVLMPHADAAAVSAATISAAPQSSVVSSATDLAPSCPRKYTWKAANQFKMAPNQANPSPDLLGNPNVWSYGMGTPGSLPYTLFTNYATSMSGSPNLQSWAGTFYGGGLPYVGKNGGGTYTDPPLGITIPGNQIFVHPFDASHASVIGWTSPCYAKKLTIKGAFAMAQSPGCANGINWTLYRGSTVLNSGASTHSSGTTNFTTTTNSIVPGDTLYLVIDSNAADFQCDTTLVTWNIKQP